MQFADCVTKITLPDSNLFYRRDIQSDVTAEDETMSKGFKISFITAIALGATISLSMGLALAAEDNLSADQIVSALRAEPQTRGLSMNVPSDHADQPREDSFVDSIRRRHWTEIAADLEELARDHPARFIAGAVLCGFIVGRLLAAPRRVERFDQNSSRPAEGAVTAAVASASKDGLAGGPLPSEVRELP